jgi:hypothetical protein
VAAWHADCCGVVTLLCILDPFASLASTCAWRVLLFVEESWRLGFNLPLCFAVEVVLLRQ